MVKMTLDKNCKKGGVHRAPGSRDACFGGLSLPDLEFWGALLPSIVSCAEALGVLCLG